MNQKNKFQFKFLNVDSNGIPIYQLPEVTVVSKIPEELRRQLVEPIYSRNSYKYNVDGVAEVNRIFDRKPLYKLTKKNKSVYQSPFDYSNPLYSEWGKQEDNNMRVLWEHGYVDLVKSLQNTLHTYGQYAYKDALELALAKIETIDRDNEVLNKVINAQHEGKRKVANAIVTGGGMLPGADTFTDIGYTVADMVQGNWKDVAIGLGFIAAPGLGYGTYKGIKNTNLYNNLQQGYRNRQAAKLIKKELNKGVKRQNYLIKRYGYNPRYITTGSFRGLPDADPNTFYHSGNFTRYNVAPKSGGYVKIQDGSIVPMQSYHPGSENRIWWNKGKYYNTGSPVIIATKSNKVNERVIDNLSKYISYHEYNPEYYTSGSIPIEELTIYHRNPFTGFYDSSIPYEPPRSSYFRKTIDLSEQINAKNAIKITDDQWDKAYNIAIVNNDLVEAQRLRDLHFKAKAPNTKVTDVVYRGWHDVPQNILNTDIRQSGWGNVTTGSWFGTDGDFIRQISNNDPERIKRYYLNLQNPFVKDANGRRWNELLPFDMTEDDLIRETKHLEKNFPNHVVQDWAKNLTSTTDQYANKIYNGNYDGGIITNIREGNTLNPMNDYVISKSSQAKLSDPITYDNGNIIPLSKRDNFLNPDVRYSWLLPIGLTLSFGFNQQKNKNTQINY